MSAFGPVLELCTHQQARPAASLACIVTVGTGAWEMELHLSASESAWEGNMELPSMEH